MRAADDFFGGPVSIDGNRILIGAGSAGINDNGASYLFDALSGAFIAKITPDDLVSGDNFGTGVISGGTIVIGSRNHDDNGTNSGSAYIFTVPITSTLPLMAFGLLMVSGLYRRRATQ